MAIVVSVLISVVILLVYHFAVAVPAQTESKLLKQRLCNIESDLNDLGSVSDIKNKLGRVETMERNLSQVVGTKVDDKLAEICGVPTGFSSSLSTGSNQDLLLGKIADRVITAIQSGSEELVKCLSQGIAEKVGGKFDGMPEPVKQQIFDRFIPDIQNQIQENGVEISSDDWDTINGLVSERLGDWARAELDNPASETRKKLIESYTEAVIDKSSDIIDGQIDDNWDDLAEEIEKMLGTIVKDELSNPDGEFRKELVAAITTVAVEKINS